MTDTLGNQPRARPAGVGTYIAETVPGMRPGGYLWNLLVAVAYAVFAPILVPLVLGYHTTGGNWS